MAECPIFPWEGFAALSATSSLLFFVSQFDKSSVPALVQEQLMSSQNLGTRPPEWRSLAMCYAAAAVSDRGLRWCRLAEGFSTQVTSTLSLFFIQNTPPRGWCRSAGGFSTQRTSVFSLEKGKDAAAVGHDVIDGGVFHKHPLSIRPVLIRCWFWWKEFSP